MLVYVEPDEQQLIWLTPALIADWGQSVATLRQVAARNLADLLAASEFHAELLEAHKLGLFATDSAFKASFLFSPNLRATVETEMGWPVFMVVPCRDFAYVLREVDIDLLPHVGRIVVREFSQSPYPISMEVFRVSDDGIEAVGIFRRPEDGLKTIAYRGGIVCFRIPDHWEEEYEEKVGATFYEDEPDSGTLRLNVLTLAVKTGVVAATATDLLQRRLKDTGGTIQPLADGNALLSYQQADKENEKDVLVYYWEIANPVPPSHCRYAIFTYTVPAYRATAAEVLAEVALLQRELEACRFAPELGE